MTKTYMTPLLDIWGGHLGLLASPQGTAQPAVQWATALSTDLTDPYTGTSVLATKP